ncbi:phosphatase PAP2 family protein [Luteithermobacter gelatinilyticus]|uniref:phosphatase PAP2 family protein n=1 Tax=Luteithermobacter gelatinilyticus TaxID=2582913 RepID=UPI0011075CDD|nr:phosphatase PAP2 family protein [Luteithermobacter gelatinilyticus]
MSEAVLNILNRHMALDRENLYRHMVLLTVFLLQAASIWTVMWWQGLAAHFTISLYVEIIYISLAAIVFIKTTTYLLRYLSYDRSEKGAGRIISDFRAGWLNADYLLAFAVPFLFLPGYISIFSSLKSVIPALQPFYLDEVFMKLDRLLHFGVDPWKITHALFGTALMSGVINFFYNLWFFLMFSYVLWQVVNVSFGAKRAQFLLAFLLCWFVLGSVLAVMLSSAGPCYYGVFVDGPDVFAPLMARLQDFYDQRQATGGLFQLYALDIQKDLLAYYQDNATGAGSGISAMPSMHVSVAMLLYLSGREVSRYVGYFFFAFLIIIQIGSVHLGWHYAVDGYVSMLGTWGLWRVSGWLVQCRGRGTGHVAS